MDGPWNLDDPPSPGPATPQISFHPLSIKQLALLKFPWPFLPMTMISVTIYCVRNKTDQINLHLI